jgi:hypothetical protein
MTPEQEQLVEQATTAWRPHEAGGPLRAHPAWHDLDAAGRAELYRATGVQRRLEAALDPVGLSGTAHAVLRRIRGAAGG